MSDSKQRVVITGMGWITPLGHDIETVWARLIAGDSGISHTERFDASTYPTTFSAEIKGFRFEDHVSDISRHENASLNSQYALAAATQAWRQSGLDRCETLNRQRTGIYLGAGEGPPDFDSATVTNLAGWDAGGDHIDPRAWMQAAGEHIDKWKEVAQDPNMAVMHLATEFGVTGPSCNCLTACAASTQAIGEAMELIRRGDADVMIAGGTHSMIHALGVTGFNRLTALSTRNDSPQTASRPYDISRDGFVLGEGAGMVILETLEHAQARGAEILAELIGFGSSADAFRITDMQPEGIGPRASMEQALRDAGLEPHGRGEDGRPVVHYISAHGTSTQENDSTETMAVKAVFGELAPEIPVSSIKSMMGHLIAAAGVVELIASIQTIRTGSIPPTINLSTPDPECDLDYVPNEARQVAVEAALSNSFGFGGQNDTLIVRRYSNGRD
ncbi:MAG: beta-ketoacyl-[acyl-carrier-protein] synthase family protein [Planctomycetes bacterium]|nr:beta-ketoacyl-[acyl-carrier-protein] synthase family protein [Planctomycetota bacterium]